LECIAHLEQAYEAVKPLESLLTEEWELDKLRLDPIMATTKVFGTMRERACLRLPPATTPLG
jgi:hypothetical protein